MIREQLQHDLQSFGGDQPDWADIERVFGQYEKYVRVRRTDKAYRTGTTAFFLLLNCALLLAFGLLAVQQAGDNSAPIKLAYLSLMGVGTCFLWWNLVKMSYILSKDIGSLDSHLRRGLQHEAIRMRWYWLLDRIPLHEDRPPEGVATALPLGVYWDTHPPGRIRCRDARVVRLANETAGLELKAKTGSQTMPSNIFLSFSMRHKNLVDRFRRQVTNGCKTVHLCDNSIKEPVEGAWKVQAEERIRASTATICLVGDSTWQSEPVNWEVRKSAELHKRVLAVYLQSETRKVPAALSEIGVTPMPWNINAIVGELNGAEHKTSGNPWAIQPAV